MPSTSRKEISVQSIVLNPGNARHDPVDSSEEAYKQLFEDAKDRDEMLALATDIARRGLDPSSLLIVQPIDGYWRVLEGNRRVAALKCMSKSELIPEVPGFSGAALTAYRDRFAHLGRSTAIPTKILVVETDDEDLANHLISLKHTGVGAHKGAGTVPWDPAGRARHEEAAARAAGKDRPRASNRQAGSALALLDALSVHFAGDSEIEELLTRARKGGLTTLGRLLIRAESQVRLGVQIDGGQARFLVERDALRSVMMRLLAELSTPALNSRTTNTAQQVVDYLDSIDQDLPTSEDRLPAAEPATAPTASAKPTKKRQKALPVLRRPFPNLVLNHAHPKTLAVLRELKTLKIDEYPYTCAILTRVLVDLYTRDVLAALKTPKIPDAPGARTLACLHLIDPPTNPRKRKFPLIWDALNTGTGDLSIDAMHNYVHRHDYRATPDVVRNQSEHYGPFLAVLDDVVDARQRDEDTSA